MADASVVSASVNSSNLEKVPSAEEYVQAEDKNNDHVRMQLSRTPSNTSLAARAYTDEEGRMHRFGQGVRREVLRHSELTDNIEMDPEQLADLRRKFEDFKGEEIRERVEREGADSVMKELGMNAKELSVLQKEDPEGFEIFRHSQIAAQINSGRRPSEA